MTDSVISFEEEPPSVEEFAARMREKMAVHPWLVHEQGGAIAGFAYGAKHRDRAAYRWAVDVSVYVDQRRHRSGIGRALYEELLDRLRAQGFQVAIAGVTLPNDASVGIHRSFGFQAVGTYRRIGWKNGAWHDVAWFQLDLIPPGDGKPPEPGVPC